MRTFLLAALAACLPAAAVAAQAPPVSVLVDGSGSMAGFGGALPALVQTLRGAGADRAYLFTFRSEHGGPARGGVRPFDPAAAGTGNVTLLWRGLAEYLDREARKAEVIALVTDNIQDPGTRSDEQRDVDQFYAELARDPRLGMVYLLPLRLPFDGTLYGRHGAGAVGAYRGERGLVVYLVSYGRLDEGRVAATARDIARRLGSEPVRMKPYRTAPVRAVVDTAASRAVAAAAGECPSAPLVPDADAPGVLARSDPLAEGRPFGGAVVVRLTSEVEGVSLSRPHVSARLLEDFRFTDFVANGDPVVQATPPRLETTLAPGDSATVRVSVCFPNGVVFDKSLRALSRFVFQPRAAGRYEGGVRIQLQLAQNELQLARRVQAFSTIDPAFFTTTDSALHRRVYGLETAFRRLAGSTVLVEAPVNYRVRFAVRYPKWPVFVLLLLLALALGGPLLAGWLLLRGRVYRLRRDAPGVFHFEAVLPERLGGVAGDPLDPAALGARPVSAAGGGAGEVIRLSPLKGHEIHLNGGAAAVLRTRPFVGPAVFARRGYVVDGERRSKPLDPRGTLFELSPGEPVARRGGERREEGADVVLDPSRL